MFAEPPQVSDPPLDMDRQLIRGLILLARGESCATAAIARDVAAQARATGYELFGVIADRVLAATAAPPPLAGFARLLWVAADD